MSLFSRVAHNTSDDYPNKDRLRSIAKTFETLSEMNEEVLSKEEINKLTKCIHDVLEEHYDTLMDID